MCNRCQGTNGLYELDIEGGDGITFSIQGRFQGHLVVNDVVECEGHRQDEPPTSQKPNRVEDFGCLTAGSGLMEFRVVHRVLGLGLLTVGMTATNGAAEFRICRGFKTKVQKLGTYLYRLAANPERMLLVEIPTPI